METLISPSAANPEPAAPKKSNTGLIIGIIVAVLLCCCCLAILGALLYIVPTVRSVYSTVNERLVITPMPEVPVIPDSSNPSTEPSATEPSFGDFMPSGVVPEGGRGDDLLRTNTWSFVLIAAAATNCVNPDPATTVIEVTQQPDSAGIWQERWSVTCEGGASKSFDITFTPDPNGGTNISVDLTQ